jgi:hypothetical protein
MTKILLSIMLSFSMISSAFAIKDEVPQPVGLPMMCASKEYINIFLKDVGEEIQLVAKAFTSENIDTVILFSFNPGRKVWTLYVDIPNGKRCVAAMGEEGFVFK